MNTEIKTEKLHWVFCCRGNRISYFLANENNKSLGCPMLRGVNQEEERALDEAGVCWEYDEGSSLYINCFPREDADKITVTAPAYIEENTEYLRIGLYTGKWTNPDEIRRVNNAVEMIVPKGKIHIKGCYVNMDN